MAAPKDEAEWRRTLLAALRGGPAVIFIDNVRDTLESATLALAITADFLQDRVIRSSEVICAPVCCLWLATANNPVLSDEMARRVVRSRLDAGTSKPELRTGFRHPKLRLWVKEERPWLVWSVVTIVKAWIAQGRPRAQIVFGGFEDWAEVIGGILEVAGFPGFLENTAEVRNAASSDDAFQTL